MWKAQNKIFDFHLKTSFFLTMFFLCQMVCEDLKSKQA
jgi:hypothetical protein